MKRAVSRRVISLWLPRFPTDRLSRRQHDWRSEPLVTAIEAGGALRVAAANRAAEAAAGIVAGMPLADARARLPGLRVVPAEPEADAVALAGLADWCGRWSPWVAVDEEGGSAAPGGAGLWLDITGCAHLFGGEAGLLDDVVGRMLRFGYTARAAIADAPGAAWAAARYGGRRRARIVPPGQGRTMLANLPPAALRLTPEDVEGLERLGLRRVEALYGIPRASLARRFGAGVGRRLDQALGFATEPLTPRRPSTRFRVQRTFAEPLGEGAALTATAAALFGDLEPLLAAAEKGARRVELVFWRVDGGTVRISAGTSTPVREAAHLARLMEERLGEVDCGFGIDMAAAQALRVEPLPARQGALEHVSHAGGGPAHMEGGEAGESNTRGGEAEAESLSRLLDRLGGRFGLENVSRLVPRESHVPERAQVSGPPFAPLPAAPVPGVAAWPRPAPGGLRRPVRLLPRPEPVDAVAMVPDAPPVMFRWRHVTHRIVRADGPERIAAEWWRRSDAGREDAIRDYYRVEDERGARFWLYRDAPYRPGMAPDWWLHGLFA